MKQLKHQVHSNSAHRQDVPAPARGGPDSYAGYLVNADGFEVELVAST